MILIAPACTGKTRLATDMSDVFMDGDRVTSPVGSHVEPWWMSPTTAAPAEQLRRVKQLVAVARKHPARILLTDVNPHALVREAQRFGVGVAIWVPSLETHGQCMMSRRAKQPHKRPLSTKDIRESRSRIIAAAASLGIPRIRDLAALVKKQRNASGRSHVQGRTQRQTISRQRAEAASATGRAEPRAEAGAPDELVFLPKKQRLAFMRERLERARALAKRRRAPQSRGRVSREER